MGSPAALTYQNPVYRASCPDPYVLKFAGEYWCYFTGLQPDGGAFGILHSTDLVSWQPRGSALAPLPGGHTCYWAPEVVYWGGKFTMYYSVGNETIMHIRAAVADQPEGPFIDAGKDLTAEEFAIDAHVFEDEDGQRYLFYATDFLDYERIGTGTVFDRLLDPLTLAGAPRPVTRARYDWQVFDPARATKGGVRWHTVEGPFVLKHDGKYYQMFSGGNWQNKTYGVSYATTGSLETPGEWEQHADGLQVLPILRTLPDLGVIGPGHNSVARGPDNRELFCIYHRWQAETEERVLAIDRLEWEGDELVVRGPTVTPQPAPRPPDMAGFGAFRCLGDGCRKSADGRSLRLSGEAAASLPLRRPDFLLEMTLQGEAGVVLFNGGIELLRLELRPDEGALRLASAGGEEQRKLPPGSAPHAAALLHLEAGLDSMRLALGEPALRLELPLPTAPDELRLYARGEALFRGLEIS